MLYSKLLKNIILPLGDRISKGSFMKKLKLYRKISLYSEKDLESLQKEKLKDFLNYATEKSIYYKLMNIKPRENPIEWLKQFPILRKKNYRENIEHIITTDKIEDLNVIMSSGSTGPPGKVYFSKDELSNNRAIQVLWWEWAGYRIGDSILQTGVNMKRTPEKRIKDILFKTKYIEALKHNNSELLVELNALRNHPKDFFIGYASSLYLFAKTALDNDILDIRFKSAISLGEKLLPHFREVIEKAFSCKVYDTYGASEGFLMAAQCKMGNYHIMSPHLIFEIVDKSGNEVLPGEMGTVLITNLDNKTTPMIRYEVGDLAVKAVNNQCSCGMAYPLLGEVIGRTTEFLVTPGKKYITVQTVVRVLKHFPEVDEFRVSQEGANDFLLEYVSQSNSEELHEKINNFFNDLFKEELNFRFNKLPQIPKSSTGKFQLIKNNYSPV